MIMPGTMLWRRSGAARRSTAVSASVSGLPLPNMAIICGSVSAGRRRGVSSGWSSACIRLALLRTPPIPTMWRARRSRTAGTSSSMLRTAAAIVRHSSRVGRRPATCTLLMASEPSGRLHLPCIACPAKETISVLPPPMSIIMPSACAMFCVTPMKSYIASSSPEMMRTCTPERRAISPTAARLLTALRRAAVAKAWTCGMRNVLMKSMNPCRIFTVFSSPARTRRPFSR